MNRFFVSVVCFLMCCSTVSGGATSKVRELKYPKIEFNTDVDEGSVASFKRALRVAENSGAQRIIVVLNTPGGSVFAGMEMGKAIEDSKATVVCVVDGMAASMGAYILQSCDERVMTKRSLIMMHQPAAGGGGFAHELRKLADLLDKLMAILDEHITARTNISMEELEKRIANGNEWWMGWKEALDRGVVDQVVVSPWELQR